MTDVHTNGHELTLPPSNEPADDLIEVVEASVRKILKNRKASEAGKVAAINAGIRLIAIRHKIMEPDRGFFG